ncbi:hypothetical protein TIFTF001_007829 [Ficus carica]|uniref:Uncharacterized protein n=1 Tax=Ficus carica TaxID=3494 RepID=A0AA87ZRY0_FICCA|nr:hypothetical protein TIFTF001_007829 [Ficus carica]
MRNPHPSPSISLSLSLSFSYSYRLLAGKKLPPRRSALLPCHGLELSRSEIVGGLTTGGGGDDIMIKEGQREVVPNGGWSPN